MNIFKSIIYKLSNLFNYIKYDIPQGLRNLLVYAPVIWNTREWDYVYLYELIAFKLKRMEHILRYGVSSDRKEVANCIKDVYKALDRLIKDDYYKRPLKEAVKRQTNDLNIVCKGLLKSGNWWD